MKTIIILFAIIFTAVASIAQPKGEQAIFDATTNSYIDYGKGMSLDGYDNINGGGQMTITLWVKWNDKSVAGAWANLFTLNDSTNNGDKGVFWIQHSQTNDKIEFALTTKDGNRKFIQSTTNPQVGNWYYIACVFDGSLATKNMKLYVNGVLEASATTQTNNNLNHVSRKINNFSNVSKLYAGRWAYTATRSFNGLMDEISVWSSALTETQINNIKINPESETGVAYDATSLVGYYNFDNGLIGDLTNRNNGTPSASFQITDNGSLPVELVEFKVVSVSGKPTMQWATATELNNNYFTVERSIDGVQATVIGVVKGAGNSNMMMNYQFVDANPVSGIAYYRIKQTDFDGTTETFDWKSIVTSLKSNATFNVYPNPTSGNVSVSLTNATAGITELTVVDLLGKVVYAQSIENDEMLSTSFDLPTELTSGIYFVQINNQNTRFVEKIILK